MRAAVARTENKTEAEPERSHPNTVVLAILAACQCGDEASGPGLPSRGSRPAKSSLATLADGDGPVLLLGERISSGSLPVTIGGPATNVTGNLELFADHLVFVPHDTWRRRQVDPMRIDTDEPIMVGGVLPGQAGPRALVVTLRPSRSRVTFRLGLALKGLDEIIGRQA